MSWRVYRISYIIYIYGFLLSSSIVCCLNGTLFREGRGREGDRACTKCIYAIFAIAAGEPCRHRAHRCRRRQLHTQMLNNSLSNPAQNIRYCSVLVCACSPLPSVYTYIYIHVYMPSSYCYCCIIRNRKKIVYDAPVFCLHFILSICIVVDVLLSHSFDSSDFRAMARFTHLFNNILYIFITIMFILHLMNLRYYISKKYIRIYGRNLLYILIDEYGNPEDFLIYAQNKWNYQLLNRPHPI